MSPDQFIKKIKKYSAISFVLPLITINLCLIIFKLLGTVDLFPNYNLSNGAAEVSYNQNELLVNDVKSYSFKNCSKYTQVFHHITVDNEVLIAEEHTRALIESLGKGGKIKTIKLIPGNIINNRCLKNHPFWYSVLTKWHLEEIFIKAKKENKSGFSKIKNPYFYGEVSISRTARYFPATLIFKPFIILSAIFLLFYWRNNLNLFNELKNNNVLNRFSKSFFYFGILSCVFLILHASLLGLDFDSKLFGKIRRLIIILFILFELSAQILLTRNLYKFRRELKKHIRSFIILVKITFVIMALSGTAIVFAFLVWGNLSTEVKHIFEWNYFSLLLIYYILSRLLWKR